MGVDMDTAATHEPSLQAVCLGQRGCGLILSNKIPNNRGKRCTTSWFTSSCLIFETLFAWRPTKDGQTYSLDTNEYRISSCQVAFNVFPSSSGSRGSRETHLRTEKRYRVLTPSARKRRMTTLSLRICQATEEWRDIMCVCIRVPSRSPSAFGSHSTPMP